MFIENTEELAQNKLLLLYLIKTSEKKLDKNEITEFMLEKDYMNYFLVQQYLSELVNSNLVLIDDKKYKTTEEGRVTLSYFKDRVNKDFKESVRAKFTKSEIELKRETEVFSEFYKKENEQFVVNLKLVEQEDILFSLYLDVANEKLAESVAKNWDENTDQIYLDIIKILTGENNKR